MKDVLIPIIKKAFTLPWILLTVPVLFFGSFAVMKAVPVNYEVTIVPIGSRDAAFSENCQLRPEAFSKLGKVYLFEYNQGESEEPLQTSSVLWKQVMQGSPETYCIGTANFTLTRDVGYMFYSGESMPASVDPWEVKNGSLRWELHYEITRKATLAIDMVGFANPCVKKGKPVLFCSSLQEIKVDEEYEACTVMGRIASLGYDKPIILRGKKTGDTFQPVIPSGKSWESVASDPLMGNEPTIVCHVVLESEIPFDPEGYDLETNQWGSLSFTNQELTDSAWVIRVRNTETELVKN